MGSTNSFYERYYHIHTIPLERNLFLFLVKSFLRILSFQVIGWYNRNWYNYNIINTKQLK